MHSHRLSKIQIFAMLAAVILIFAAVVYDRHADAQSSSAAATASDSELIAEFRHVEVASVSDAMEQIIHKRMYMSHRMKPIFTSKFVCRFQPS